MGMIYKLFAIRIQYNMQLFVDSDGVLAHYNRNVVNFFGKHPRDVSTEELWLLVNSEPNFWPSMPIKDGAKKLWEFLKPYNPIVITGCPKDDYENAAKHKTEWIKKTFGDHVQVITCLAKDKQNHMIAPGDILIDDFKSNIKRWNKAGGRGIWFRNVDQAIAEFKVLVLEA